MKIALLTFSLMMSTAPAQQAPRANATELPVRELTAFKDGHAYVVREAALPPDADGTVVLDQLPKPVLGTFWPFATGGARVVSAKAGRERVEGTRQVTSLADIARANVGRSVELELGPERAVSGKLVEASPKRGAVQLLLVRHDRGLTAVPIGSVTGMQVFGEFVGELASTSERERLRLRIDGGGANARIGVAYVQKGFRWIPSYRIDLDGDGKARVQLQATLVNDLVDLDDATVQLVVGVPEFAFADLVDPISLQQQVAQVAAARGYQQLDNGIGNFLSNSIMTQVPTSGAAAPVAPADPDVGGGESNEDLFVFPVRHVTLAKGERLVVPVASFELPYRDVYRYDVAITPPVEHQQNLQDNRVFELAKQLAAAKVRHVLRLDNDSEMPLTTAPALVLQQGRVLAQGHMRYASRGQQADLEINVAVDVRVDDSEHETSRQPNVRLNGDDYTRVSLTGTIGLTNSKAVAVDVEVTRRVLGLVDEVGQQGDKQQLDLVSAWSDRQRPQWWTWWYWPYWWFRHNGFGECRWSVTLQPGEQVELTAGWHYYWR